MKIYEITKDEFLISTDRSLLDKVFIHAWLSSESYWAAGIPFETVERSIEHSFCFGIYKNAGTPEKEQVGFARVITDHASFAYLADVFITEPFRGKGLSKWLMEFIMSNPELQGLRRWMLATRDAHGLYEQFGFVTVADPSRLMQVVKPAIYQQKEQHDSPGNEPGKYQ